MSLYTEYWFVLNLVLIGGIQWGTYKSPTQEFSGLMVHAIFPKIAISAILIFFYPGLITFLGLIKSFEVPNPKNRDPHRTRKNRDPDPKISGSRTTLLMT